MKKQLKKILVLLLTAAMAVGALAGCGEGKVTGKDGKQELKVSYPVEPQELGSGSVKWKEVETKDNWNRVTNEGGATLGYARDSGIKLIQVDGFAFKDLNKNGKLDMYEDWRQDDAKRAKDIASKLTIEDVVGLMLFSGHQRQVSEELTEEQMTFLEGGGRFVLSAAFSAPTGAQSEWANAMQAYAEGMGLGIPVMIATDPRSSGVSKWPDNLALAATFDPEIALAQGKQLSREYRALGLGILLGPQVDLASEPRWTRFGSTFGEDPALSRDMTEAAVSGYQSTFDENGKDLGWGSESIISMIKHWVSEGMGQSGRESHGATGQFNVFPGGQFETGLIPFVDGGFNLKHSSTGSAKSVMTSYSIAYDPDERYGELVGTAFSDYKVGLLRDYGFDGAVCTDWGVLGFSGWGVEDLTPAERVYKSIGAGVDQFGGQNDPAPIMEAYDIMVDELGEEAALARFRESGDRTLRNFFTIGLFDNPYVDVAYAKETVNSKEAAEAGRDAQLKGIVMLKNDGAIAKAADKKPTVYVPLVYSPTVKAFWGTTPARAKLPVDRKTLSQYFNVVTDKISDNLTGPADTDGNPTVAFEDIIRATPEELEKCDFALAIVRSPGPKSDFGGAGYDAEKKCYIPLSLQYRPYTADTESVRTESIAGPMVETEVQSVYGAQTIMAPQNCSYFGKSTTSDAETDLDMILYAAENMPETAKVIVAANTSNPMVVAEFEDKVDAILMGFGVDNSVFLDIVSGKVEPSGLLPIQIPVDMDTVEANFEDVPRDMICHIDSMGNTYDFAFGMNWSGVISDERTAKYNVPPLVSPEVKPQTDNK